MNETPHAPFAAMRCDRAPHRVPVYPLGHLPLSAPGSSKDRPPQQRLGHQLLTSGAMPEHALAGSCARSPPHQAGASSERNGTALDVKVSD